jgi:hypothetical protein
VIRVRLRLPQNDVGNGFGKRDALRAWDAFQVKQARNRNVLLGHEVPTQGTFTLTSDCVT